MVSSISVFIRVHMSNLPIILTVNPLPAFLPMTIRHKSLQTENISIIRLHIARVHLKLREKCPECGKQVQDLYAHNLYVHKKERNFPCDQCDARLYTSFALKSHIESVHLGERVKCPDCSVLFAKAYINKHRKQCFSKHSYAKFRVIACVYNIFYFCFLLQGVF